VSIPFNSTSSSGGYVTGAGGGEFLGGTSIFVRGLCFGVAALYLTTTKIKMVVIIMPHTTQPGIDTESLGVGGLLFPLFV
jgi:hypothetical protein